jgi:hypothetical protein
MLLVMAQLSDGSTRHLILVPASFDVEVWAKSRRESFRLLGIVGLEVIEP